MLKDCPLSPDRAALATLMATQIDDAVDLADEGRVITALAGRFPARDIVELLDAAIAKARRLRVVAALAAVSASGIFVASAAAAPIGEGAGVAMPAEVLTTAGVAYGLALTAAMTLFVAFLHLRDHRLRKRCPVALRRRAGAQDMRDLTLEERARRGL